jgi:NACalpha-BTF3-like transcription factor
VTISKEDVELIMNEMEIPKSQAEQTLREHAGDVVQAFISLTD